MNILYVDDSVMICKAVKGLFEVSERIDFATNGRECLDMYNKSISESNQYDIIFLDLDMPLMRGEQVLHSIRNYEDIMSCKNTIVIIVSAFNDCSKVLELFKIGCDYFLKKPISTKCINDAFDHIFKPKSEEMALV